MKRCLQCDQVYGDDTNFCLSDGSTLVSASGSYASHADAPTVFSGAAFPTSQSNNPPFVPPVSYQSTPAPEPKKSHAFLIVLVVGFFALLIGGAVVGIVVYSVLNQGKTDPSVANVSNSNNKANKTASPEQKNDNDELAKNLKQQQDKLDKDKQKLEDDRKALENKKKEAAQTPKTDNPSVRTATIIDPPTNIRLSPNGSILCVIRQRTSVNILGSTGVTDNNGTWYYTDACGREGVIHSSQIRF